MGKQTSRTRAATTQRWRLTLALEYAESADNDLDAIADHHEALKQWQAALDIPDELRARAREIPDNPLAWPIGDSSSRERVVVELQYRIVYDVTESHVRVLHFKHTRQLWPLGRN